VEDALKELTKEFPVGGTLMSAPDAGPLVRRVLQGDQDDDKDPHTEE
jgi:hypothetical protein